MSSSSVQIPPRPRDEVSGATSCYATLPRSGHIVHYFLARARAGESSSTVASKGTVFCVHGFPDTSFGWRKQVVAIAKCGYDVVVPDQV